MAANCLGYLIFWAGTQNNHTKYVNGSTLIRQHLLSTNREKLQKIAAAL